MLVNRLLNHLTNIHLGTETTKTVTGLKASATYYYQATSGTWCRTAYITTPAASGVPALTASDTIEFIREIGKDTTQSVSLSGVYMNNEEVSVAITGVERLLSQPMHLLRWMEREGYFECNLCANFFTNLCGKPPLRIQRLKTKTVVVNLVGNVPGIDMVEINGDATGFVILPFPRNT